MSFAADDMIPVDGRGSDPDRDPIFDPVVDDATPGEDESTILRDMQALSGRKGPGFAPPPPPSPAFSTEAPPRETPPRGNGRRRPAEDRDADEKRILVYRINKIKTVPPQPPVDMTWSLEDLVAEFERRKEDAHVGSSVDGMKTGLFMCCLALEELVGKYVPKRYLSLKGWSLSVNDNMDGYNDVLEELHYKYLKEAAWSPEFKLLGMLLFSAITCAVMQKMSEDLPGAEQVFKENPQLRKDFQAAAMRTATPVVAKMMADETSINTVIRDLNAGSGALDDAERGGSIIGSEDYGASASVVSSKGTGRKNRKKAPRNVMML